MYNKHFGFSEAPFNITPNSRFYFRTGACDEILQIVQHGILSRKGVIVVTGEAGTGKTLLVRSLEHDLAPTVKAVVVQNPHTDFDTMLQVLLKRLELHSPAAGRTARLEQLTGHLIEQRSQGAIVCLLVDEAQDLDAHTLDEIRLLANLEFAGDALLPIVLIGQPELHLKLDHPGAASIKQRIALTRTTHRLIRMEIEPYIRSRLQVAGHNGSALFDSEAIDVIAAYSGGIPRLVNSICDNSLIRGYAANETVISAEIVDQAARDLRIAACFETGKQFTRRKLAGISSAPTAVAGQAAGAREGSMSDMPEQPAAQFADVPLDDTGSAHARESQPASLPELEKAGIPADFAANTAPSMFGLKRSAPNPSDRVSGLPKLKAHSENLRRALPVHLRWYGVAAGIGLALLLLNVASSLRLGVVYSSKSSPQESTAGDAASHAGYSGRERSEGFREARFVPPSTNLVPEQIDITDFRQREDGHGARASAERSANGKTTGPVKDAPSRSPQNGEPRRSEAAGPAAMNGSRSDDAPKIVRVFADSLLRKRPSASAEIISTLEPGSRVTVLARAGDFYQIRSLDKHPIRGYVHREDAFFERKK